MATRLKTVQFAFTPVASMTDNTTTAFPQLTIYLPETGTKTFRSVILRVSYDDIITGTGGTQVSKTLRLRLGAAGFTSVSNTNSLGNSGENMSIQFAQDFTAHFTTNWSGTSMTCDADVLVDQTTGTTLGQRNLCGTLEITYEYDDTSTTQVKTVYLPLNSPIGGVASTKPGSPIDTIPALDTFLPEASKTYRNISIVFQGNVHLASNTTDHDLQAQIDSLTQLTTGAHEAGLGSDRWIRYVWIPPSFTTNATHGLYIWGSQTGRYLHLQCWMQITYEFDASATTDVMNSLILPMEFDSPMGNGSTNPQHASRELMIEEPGTITKQNCALFLHYECSANIPNYFIRIAGGSYTNYTDAVNVVCGGVGAMMRAESDLTLARGRNILEADVYTTNSVTADQGWNISAFWMINYTSSKHTDGVGAHNHTVLWSLSKGMSTIAAAARRLISAVAPTIPESEYCITAIGTQLVYINAGSGLYGGINVSAERLSGEGYVNWESAYRDINESDQEVGVHYCYSQIRDLFLRWPGDPGTGRMDVEASRQWRIIGPKTGTLFSDLTLILTYHSIKFAVAGTVSGSAGGTVTLNVCRTDDAPAAGERILETSRTGDGAYSVTWYDDTEELYVESYENGTHIGRSDNMLAA